jgi:two-component system, NtrC family, response regulator HupR/HoxA
VAESAPKVRPVVLLVDDEPELLESMRLTLKDDYEIETATSAEDALLMAGTRAFDVVVCAQLLPGEQGLDFLMRAATQFPQTRRILLTGYINPELLSRGVALAGLSCYLLKPPLPVDLRKAIGQALAK